LSLQNPPTKALPRGEVRGDLEVFSPFSILQVLCQARKSGYVEIRRDDGRRASCWLLAGTVNHAECDSLRGRAALHEILSWNRGSLHYYAGDGGGASSERILLEELVMNAVAARDESKLTA